MKLGLLYKLLLHTIVYYTMNDKTAGAPADLGHQRRGVLRAEDLRDGGLLEQDARLSNQQIKANAT